MILATKQKDYKEAKKGIKGYKVLVKKNDGTYWTPYMLYPVRFPGQVNDMKDLTDMQGMEIPVPEIKKVGGGIFHVDEDGLFSMDKDLAASQCELKWRMEAITPNESDPESGYHQLTADNLIIVECVIPEGTPYVEGTINATYLNEKKNERQRIGFYSARKMICTKELKK